MPLQNNISNNFDPTPWADYDFKNKQALYEFGAGADANRAAISTAQNIQAQAQQTQALAQLEQAHANTAQTLASIQENKRKLDMAQQDLDAKHKIQKIMFDRLKSDPSATPIQIQQQEELLKNQQKNSKAILNAHNTIIDQAHHDYAMKLQDIQNQGKFLISDLMVSGAFNPQIISQVKDSGNYEANNYQGSAIRADNMPTTMVQGGQAVQPSWNEQMAELESKGIDTNSVLDGTGFQGYQKEPKVSGSLSVNPLKVAPEDIATLEQAYNLRKQGQEVAPEEILNNISPENAVLIQGMLDYDTDPVSFPTRNNARSQMIAMAKMVDPAYDPLKYKERAKYKLELASESSYIGKQKNSLNTVAQHVAQLDNYIDALGGGNIKPVNMVVNFAKEMTGDPSIVTYEQANEAVMSEMQRLLTGVGVTQAGMAEARKIIDRNTGYEAKKAAMKSLVKLIEGRISSLRQGYKSRMGKDENGEILYPESKEIFDKYLTDSPNSKETTGQFSYLW